ncbi:MAG: dihydroneopterin aldolase [Kiritimatiellia bacterium]
MDQLKIEQLTVDCILGDLPEERITPTRITIDLAIEADFSHVRQSDQLSDTIDYAHLVDQIRTTLQAGHFKMIERAAQAIADVALQDSRVHSVHLTLRKPNAKLGLTAAFTLTQVRN